jgi:hypothetical protein
MPSELHNQYVSQTDCSALPVLVVAQHHHEDTTQELDPLDWTLRGGWSPRDPVHATRAMKRKPADTRREHKAEEYPPPPNTFFHRKRSTRIFNSFQWQQTLAQN